MLSEFMLLCGEKNTFDSIEIQIFHCLAKSLYYFYSLGLDNTALTA